MKKLLLIILLGVIAQFGFSQSVTINCPSSVEVGISGTFTATFDNGGQSGITVTRYEWSIAFNGDGISGQSGISGNTNGQTSFTDPLVITTSSTTNTITVTWGGFFDLCS